MVLYPSHAGNRYIYFDFPVNISHFLAIYSFCVDNYNKYEQSGFVFSIVKSSVPVPEADSSACAIVRGQ